MKSWSYTQITSFSFQNLLQYVHFVYGRFSKLNVSPFVWFFRSKLIRSTNFSRAFLVSSWCQTENSSEIIVHPDWCTIRQFHVEKATDGLVQVCKYDRTFVSVTSIVIPLIADLLINQTEFGWVFVPQTTPSKLFLRRAQFDTRGSSSKPFNRSKFTTPEIRITRDTMVVVWKGSS